MGYEQLTAVLDEKIKEQKPLSMRTSNRKCVRAIRGEKCDRTLNETYRIALQYM